MVWVRRSSVRVRRSSVRVRRSSVRVRSSSVRVRSSSVGNESACCKAGPSLGSAPHGGSYLAERRSNRIQENRPQRMVKNECVYDC
jgi:hypothetical protein